jgi:recombination protein RecA
MPKKSIIQKASELEEVAFAPTGIDKLDAICGGGFPVGRMVTIAGMYSSGKTSLALHLIAQYQKRGWPCVYLDAEQSFNPAYSARFGVELDKLRVVIPDYAEEGLDAVAGLLEANKAKFIVVDSVAALSARAEVEASYEAAQMSLQARFMSRALRKLVPLVKQKDAILVWINQLRQNIMGGSWEPYYETGGMALKFYTSLNLRLTKKNALKQDGRLVGYGIQVKVKKNKVGEPEGEAMVNLMLAGSFHGETSVLEKGLERGLITRKGAWYYWGETQLGRGQEEAEAALTEEMVAEIKQ